MTAKEREQGAALSQTSLDAVSHLWPVLESASIGIALLDGKFRFVEINKKLAHMNGVSRRKHLGRTVEEVLPELWPNVKFFLEDVLATGQPVESIEISGEVPQAPGEKHVWLASYYPTRDDSGAIDGLALVVVEITDRKNAETALAASEQRFRGLFENMLEGFAYCEAIYGLGGDLVDWTYLDVNMSFERLTGLTGVVGRKVSKVLPGLRKENPDLFGIYGSVAITGKAEEFETWLPALEKWFHVSVFGPAKNHFVAVFEDITERKRGEEALLASEKRLQAIIDAAPFGAHLYHLEADDRLIYVAGNESADRILGIDCDQFIGMTLEEAFPGNVGTELPDMYKRAARTGEPYSTFQTNYDASGISGIFEVHAVQTAPNQMVAFFRDVTEAQRAENALKESEERYRGIFDHANEGIVRTNFKGKLITLNRRFAEIMGYTSPEQLTNEIENFKSLYLDLGDRGALLKDLRELGAITDHELQLKQRDGSAIWVSVNISTTTDPQTGEKFLDGLVVDIAQRKAAEDKLRKSHRNLEESLLGLVSTLAMTVETRDPYTAEHQRRVTELAVAIANEAKFSDRDIASLQMAATIHDVGKIFVPAETLNKPGKVSDVEFELIKTHAAAGYNIIKDVKFDQPIAEIIHQHHERMDGSGYPDGLKGDKIHARARIVAIADVVEAMSSHRPYRPALGIEAALEEIEKNSGNLYDPTYAAICLKLFRQKHFEFK